MNKSSLIKTVSTAAAAVSAALAILLSAHSCTDENGISSAFLKQRKENAACVTDPRDNKKYRTVKIGGVTWMAENANYEIDEYSSRCYDSKPKNCEKYGRLYNWEDAVMYACPNGWRLPDDTEWDALKREINGDARLLKDRSWAGGEDKYGWSGLPGGYKSRGIDTNAGWWSFTERDSANANDWRIMGNSKDSAYNKLTQGYGYNSYNGRFLSHMESVRCVDAAGLAARYYVLFDAKGGRIRDAEKRLVTTVSGAPLGDKFPMNPTKSYNPRVFAGWFDSTSGALYDRNTPITKNTILTAKWEESKVTITFDTDGGTPENIVRGERNTLTADSGFLVSNWASVRTPTKPGKVFTAWVTGVGDTVDTNTVFHKDVTLTARYRDRPTHNIAEMVDPRDGKRYGTVAIGGITWMAENINYETANSWCYNDSAAYCEKWGRLYTWDAAKTACPSGWKLPDTTDWQQLVTTAGGKSVAGKALKAMDGWCRSSYYWNDCPSLYRADGDDTFGFSALPGGIRGSGSGVSSGRATNGYWWTANDLWYDDKSAWDRSMGVGSWVNTDNSYTGKNSGLSVRCVKE